eukprot:2834410-Prymnesium_polylepis.1
MPTFCRIARRRMYFCVGASFFFFWTPAEIATTFLPSAFGDCFECDGAMMLLLRREGARRVAAARDGALRVWGLAEVHTARNDRACASGTWSTTTTALPSTPLRAFLRSPFVFL